MIPPTYTTDDRGHRVFTVSNQNYQAFWMSLGHRWIVYNEGTKERREFRNWREVSVFIARQSSGGAA